MKKINKYSLKGTKTQISVPQTLAEQANPKLIAQVVRVYEDRIHPGNKSTKTRSEINITKKKIYRQKGTGNARHGAASAPIFVGGGVALGPRPGKRVLKLSQAMRIKAAKGALAQKVSEQKVASADLSKLTKTKEAFSLVSSIKKDMKFKASSSTLVILATDSLSSHKAIRNIANVSVLPQKNFNAYEISKANLIILDSNLV